MAIDPVQERQRLIDVYSHMTDGELQELAEDTASLTGLASQVLNDEIARRELSPLQHDPAAMRTIPGAKQRTRRSMSRRAGHWISPLLGME